ncbi:histidine phosphatase family protein [Nocardioides sp. WL0053]|uniref:Histidine phosphatase family protein n=1 Tax=Nocardioides jiangsuensis TaxID=2866161 RepID=A0ABS7RGB1_9ACTN|nr:histidine phosphatase family protein [Nocardioides jiangsuensis]MBY9074076.1 histidine phosphatase family protein [Nocardioides jiangsuensis]
MSQVLLVRHGQASWGSDDYDVLSDLGERQSRLLGEALAARGVVPDLVVRGAMRRHRQTAEQAVAGAGWAADVVVDDGWNEFDHVQMLAMHPPAYGEGEELTREQFQAWFEEATLRWTGGAYDEDYDESFTAFGARVDAALRRTVERLEPKQTAVVLTSGGPVSWVAASLLAGGADLWTQLNPVTVNSSVTKIVVGRRGATLVSFNDHSHLEAAGGGHITYR